MSEHEYDINVMYNSYDFPSQDMEMEDQEGVALLDQEEEQTEDYIEPLVCGEGDIFADSLFSDSQLVEAINNPNQDPVMCPTRDAETEKALQPENFNLTDDVEERDASLYEQNSEEHQGPGAQELLHSPVETL